jgi:hypothetical protein
VYTGFEWSNLNEIGHVKDIIIDDIKIDLEGRGLGGGGMGWIDLAQDGDKWWVVVNTAMKFQVQ